MVFTACCKIRSLWRLSAEHYPPLPALVQVRRPVKVRLSALVPERVPALERPVAR